MSDPRKPIFDALRAALGGSLTAEQVAVMDDCLDRLNVPREAQGGRRAINAAGLQIIKESEGLAMHISSVVRSHDASIRFEWDALRPLSRNRKTVIWRNRRAVEVPLRLRRGNRRSRHLAQQGENPKLRLSGIRHDVGAEYHPWGGVREEKAAIVSYLERDAGALPESIPSVMAALWGAWNTCLLRVGGLRNLQCLGKFGGVPRHSVNRQDRQRRTLRAGQLPLGGSADTIKKHEPKYRDTICWPPRHTYRGGQLGRGQLRNSCSPHRKRHDVYRSLKHTTPMGYQKGCAA